MFVQKKKIVLKRCISGLPTDECPRIPKRYLEQYQLNRPRRSIPSGQSDTISALPELLNASVQQQAQIANQESKIQCEERRQLGQQILIEKVHKVDSMLSRFVGNFISHISNTTNSQEVHKLEFI